MFRMSQFARVLLDQSAGKPLDYAIPETLADRVAIGSRVRVPLRTRLVTATVVSLHEETDAQGVRELAGVIGDSPMIRPVLLRLARWMADYYCCPVEVATRAVLPVVVRKAEVSHKMRAFVELAGPVEDDALDALRRKAPRQAGVIDALVLAGGALEVAGLTGMRPAIKALEKLKLVSVTNRKVGRDPEGTYLASPELAMNPEQSEALQIICAAIDAPEKSKPVLLLGVTGSGKTEVYLQAIRHTLALGKTALVMVPEISLTPQTVERFKSRFATMQSEVAVMHSHLSDGERHDEWHKIHSGAARIAIGARSAVFAPLERVGLIVVDEEHEPSYKQEEAPRYHGRDLAVLRASLEPCAIVLGSATPSLESFHNVEMGKYQLAELPSRIDDRRMPLIRVVDMRQQNRKGSASPVLSPMLCASIERRLDAGQQTILFLNRRGYASALLCNVCGHVCHCPNCSVALTYHRDDERIRCHICGHAEVAPQRCPECKDPGIRQAGVGTQKIEESVRRVFARARVARMDADSMARKGSYRETLDRFKRGEIDILVGTQMIAKGLHFPNVTLVGIINADTGLHVADFRAGERTFQLLTQVAGRAGRGDFEGEVLVQTFTPSSPSIQFARHHDFRGYWDQESTFRRQFDYPPFSRFVLITVRGVNLEKVALCAETLERRLREQLPADVTIGQAAPAPIARAKTFYRYHVSLRGPSAPRMSRAVRAVVEALTLPSDVLLAVDVDAQQLL